jgi:hypothetical protein
MYAVELLFTISDPALAPTDQAVAAAIQRRPDDPGGRVEHVRVARLEQEFRVVLFLVSRSQATAGMVGEMIGCSIAAEFSAISFAGLAPWRLSLPTDHDSAAE